MDFQKTTYVAVNTEGLINNILNQNPNVLEIRRLKGAQIFQFVDEDPRVRWLRTSKTSDGFLFLIST